MNENLFPIRKLFKKQLLILVPLSLAGLTNSALAQQATISLSSGSTAPPGTLSINITLEPSGGAQPAALEWTLNYPASAIASVDVAAGASATAAGKSVTCAAAHGSTKCVLFGTNKNILNPGIAATATFHIASGALDSLAPIQVAGVVAADANRTVIPSSASSGVITIIQPALPRVAALPAVHSSQKQP